MNSKTFSIAFLAVMVLIACGKNSGVTKVAKPGGKPAKNVLELSKIQNTVSTGEVEKEEKDDKTKKVKNRRKTVSSGKTCLSLQKLRKVIKELNDSAVIVSSYDVDVQFEGSSKDLSKKNLIRANVLSTDTFKPRINDIPAVNLITKEDKSVEYVSEFLREISDNPQPGCGTITMDRMKENGAASLPTLELNKSLPQVAEFVDGDITRKIQVQGDNVIMTKTITKVSVCDLKDVTVTQSFVVNFNPNSNRVLMSPVMFEYIKTHSKNNFTTPPVTPWAYQTAMKTLSPNPKEACPK